MATALGLARRGLGCVWPNPAVGCVLVREGRVAGRGATAPGGRPHAETIALERAGSAAQGATAYLTLEPCAHHGKTPPCAQALIAAGIGRAVVALEDPDPRVRGRGLEALRQKGIEVSLGVLEGEAVELNAGFIARVTQGRPLVVLKLASSLDGRIATQSGESRWITGEVARARAHLLRAQHDAVMIGVGTAVSDDPLLSVRLPGLEQRTPIRIVVDSRLRLPLTSRVVATAAQQRTWLVTLESAARERAQAFQDAAVEVITVAPTAEGVPDLAEALHEFGRRGLTRLLVEGGAALGAALLAQRLVDRLVWFHAPRLIGGDGVPAIAPFGLERLAEAPRFERTSLVPVGDDVMALYRAVG
ncbi:MAG TPA: bifunctional diaminohydroxyphosphoribosylaminopyrimidine deaminase/5-amino-6-(5-phosphoribosylamino)uracil reductase RibD [Alphaproteobacteria bacterium]|nr:bifunctional diaminohydroxyphosphoribosylaminopyrimidine deaminase/5-amino-6-(5-phosphoribosylamino)uracil reductase RibD [Alphaproteobacteria bacterium]